MLEMVVELGVGVADGAGVGDPAGVGDVAGDGDGVGLADAFPGAGRAGSEELPGLPHPTAMVMNPATLKATDSFSAFIRQTPFPESGAKECC